jgi:ribonuclease P protein component
VASDKQAQAFDDDERLRKTERLRKRPEFLKTQRKGTRRSGKSFIVYGRPTERSWSRLGVTASRRVGNAIERNWWKRRVREIFRRNKDTIPTGFDFVVIVKASGKRDDFETLSRELLELIKRIGKSE